MKIISLIILILSLSTSVFGAEEIVFSGIPEKKITETGLKNTPEILSSEKSIKYKCTITTMEGKYSRGR